MARLIRCHGGKGKSPELLDFFPIEPITSYCEPFAGGAGLFWMLPTSIKRYLNDIDPVLIALYKEARDNPNFSRRILAMVRKTERADDMYREFFEQRVRYKFDADPYAYFIVNRGSFGCYCSRERANGATLAWNQLNGGLNPFTPESLKEIVQTLQGVKLTAWDYKRAIESCSPDTFLFIDPPYLSNGQIYGNEMTREQLEDMADYLSAEKRRFLMTLGASEFSKDLYGSRDFTIRIRQYSNSYNPQKVVRVGQEMMITNVE